MVDVALAVSADHEGGALIRVLGWRPFKLPGERRRLQAFESLVNATLSEYRAAGNPPQSGRGQSAEDAELQSVAFPREAVILQLLVFANARLRVEAVEGIPDFRAELRTIASARIAGLDPNVAVEQQDSLIDELVESAHGSAFVLWLLSNPEVSEVTITGPDSVVVERFGRRERVAYSFGFDAALDDVAHRLIRASDVAREAPIVQAQLRSGEALTAIFPPVASDGLLLVITKKRPVLLMDDLLKVGAVSEQIADVLRACVESRLNILVTGQDERERSTLLAALSRYFRRRERVVLIEHGSTNVAILSGHVVRLHADRGRAGAERDPRALIRAVLGLRSDRVVLDHVVRDDALEIIGAINEGLTGVLISVRAASAAEGFFRLADLAGSCDAHLSREASQREVSSAIDVVVHFDRLPTGPRVVTSICAVHSPDEQVYSLDEIVRYVPGEHGSPGDWVYTELPPAWLERFRIYGSQFRTGAWAER